jgi:antitoxin HigA-1
MKPIHPGDVLAQEYLAPWGITRHALAVAIGVNPDALMKSCTANVASALTALRLSRYYGTSERFRINLQSRYDIEVERERIDEALRRSTPLAG